MRGGHVRERTETFPLCLEAPQPASLLAPMRLGIGLPLAPTPNGGPRYSAAFHPHPVERGAIAFGSCSQQSKYRHALAAAAQLLLAQRLQVKAVVETGGGRAADEHDDIVGAGVDLLAELLQALSDVHRIPDERVVDAAGRTDIADHRRAGVNADAQANGPQVFGAPALVVLSQRQCNRPRRTARAQRVIALDGGRTPEDHHGVADVLVDRALFGIDTAGEQAEMAVEELGDLGRR